ncbi:MAG: 50S ribosomal protein P1 [Nanoarchaeota archaeon]
MEYVYGALLLHKLGKPVDAEHLTKVVHATGVSVDDAKVKTLVASLKEVNIEQELANASLAVAAPANAGAAHAPKAEEKKEEKKKEEAAEGLSALFG